MTFSQWFNERFFTATFTGLLVLESSFFVGGHVSHACIYVRTGQGLSLFGLGAPVWRRGAGRVACFALSHSHPSFCFMSMPFRFFPPCAAPFSSMCRFFFIGA